MRSSPRHRSRCAKRYTGTVLISEHFFQGNRHANATYNVFAPSLLAAGVALLSVSGWASADPPSRVARLGYMTGAVSFSPAGENDWVQATINRPLTTGDRLWADAGARAEVQIGGAMIRMNAGTERRRCSISTTASRSCN